FSEGNPAFTEWGVFRVFGVRVRRLGVVAAPFLAFGVPGGPRGGAGGLRSGRVDWVGTGSVDRLVDCLDLYLEALAGL
ncbi:unnamed protein product, partial [marine sediment metagenome]